jgi:hypothetical protein
VADTELERQSRTYAVAFCLGGIAAAVVGVAAIVPVTHDSVGRDAAFFLALPLLGGVLAGLLRTGRWVRLPLTIGGSLVASFAGIELIADPSAAPLMTLLVALAVTVGAVLWPARAERRTPSPDPTGRG